MGGRGKKVNQTPWVPLSVTYLDSSTAPSRMYAALLTRISIRPYAAFASATAFRIFSSVSQTSRARVAAPRAFRSSIFFGSRAVATTLSPFFRAALTSKPPKPEEHPVMSQTFGDIFFYFYLDCPSQDRNYPKGHSSDDKITHGVKGLVLSRKRCFSEISGYVLGLSMEVRGSSLDLPSRLLARRLNGFLVEGLRNEVQGIPFLNHGLSPYQRLAAP